MVMIKTKNGMVSIFLVVFSTILLSLITIGFIRIMLDDQKRAINSDLADSARDSALAGVADAKRALLHYNKEICKDPVRCGNILNNYLQANSCDAVQGVFGNNTGKETKIQTLSSADNDLDQAYTCVKIKYYTDNYERDLDSGEQALIPLDLTEGTQQINLRWGIAGEAGVLENVAEDNYGSDGSKWLKYNEYGDKQPSVLIVQHIQLGKEPRILYLRPNATGVNEVGFGYDSNDKKQGSPGSAPGINIRCNAKSIYPCNVKLTFTQSIAKNSKTDFLRIIKLYGGKAALKLDFGSPGGSGVRFNGIQPEIDSTGRANYIFRRLKARVEFTDGLFPYPLATLNVNGDICKDFEITNQKIKMNTECDVEATH